MAWLSDGAEALVADLASGSADFDAVVVGSGYGGAVAACRLAEAGYKACVLERGEEYLPGDFLLLLGDFFRSRPNRNAFADLSRRIGHGPHNRLVR